MPLSFLGWLDYGLICFSDGYYHLFCNFNRKNVRYC